VNKREGWMTNLPEERGPLGTLVGEVNCRGNSLSVAYLGPRTFDRKGLNTIHRGETAEWTDTPADRIRKAEEAKVRQ
jgi:hypothetical protein